MVAMTTTARRPLNWNLLTVDSRTPEKTARQLEASQRAAEAGGRIVALTMPTLVPMNMSFRTHCALFLIPGWGDVMGLPVEERIEKLARPEGAGRARRVGPLRERRRLPPAVQLGQLHHRRHLRPRKCRSELARRGLDRRGAGQAALRHPPRPGHRRRPADRAVAQGFRRRRRLVEARVEVWNDPGRWSAGPTPAPTSTGCAAPTTRPRSSATASANASWYRWSGLSS